MRLLPFLFNSAEGRHEVEVLNTRSGSKQGDTSMRYRVLDLS